MPGNSASRCLAISSSSGTNVRPSPTGTKRGSISFGTFTRANVCDVGDRVAHDHAERQRQVGDVGERAPEPDGQRRQHREDLAPEALVERARARRRSTSSSADDPDAVLGQRGPQRRAPGSAPGARCARATARADRVERLARRAPVLQRRLDAGVDLVVQAGDADHEELVEVRRVDRAELHALQQRDARVLGELEHALVELEPRQLAVEVERADRRGRALGGLGRAGRCRSRLVIDRARQRPRESSCYRPASSSRTPSRSPPRPICSGRPSALRGGVEHQQPGGQQPHALARRVEKRAATSAAGPPASTRSARCSESRVEHLADEPAQRGGAAADRDRGVDRRRVERRSSTPCGVRRAPRRSSAASGGSRAQVARRPGGPSRRGTTSHHVDAAGDRADRDLGRAAADVDHRRRCPASGSAERARGAEERQPRLLRRRRARSTSTPPRSRIAAAELVAVGGARGSRPWRPTRSAPRAGAARPARAARRRRARPRRSSRAGSPPRLQPVARGA